MFKRKFLVASVIGLVLLAGAGGAWWWVGRSGSSGLEEYVRGYLVRAMQKHLNVEIGMAGFDYRYPRTVVISDLQLIHDNVTLLSVRRLQLELAEVPNRGEPVVVERVDLLAPSVALNANPDGGLAGWSNLVKREAVKDPSSVEPGFRLSDFLRIRHAAIRDAAVTYRPAASGAAMTLTALEANLDTPPDTDAPGWFRVLGTVRRADLFDLDFNTRINLDTGELGINKLRLAAALDAHRRRVLPPQLQDFLRAHDAQGRIALDLSGTWPLGAVGERRLALSAELNDVRFAAGPTSFAAPRLGIESELAGDDLTAQVEGEIGDGSADVSADVNLSGKRPAELTARFHDVDIAWLASLTPAETRCRIEEFQPAGRVSGEMYATLDQGKSPPLQLHADAVVTPLSIVARSARMESSQVALNADAAEARMVVDLSGSWPLGAHSDRQAVLSAVLENMRFTTGSTGFSAARVSVNSELVGDDLWARVAGAIGEGTADLSASLDLGRQRPDELTARLERVDIAALVGLMPPDLKPQVAEYRPSGRITGDVQATLPVEDRSKLRLQAQTILEPLALVARDAAFNSRRAQITADAGNGRVNLTLTAEGVDSRFGASLLSARAVKADLESNPEGAQVNLEMNAAGGNVRAQGGWNRAAPRSVDVTVIGEALQGDAVLSLVPPEARSRFPIVPHGALSGRVEGKASLADWKASDLSGSLDLAIARVRMGHASLEARSASVNGQLRERRLNLEFKTGVGDGAAEGRIEHDLSGVQPLAINGTARSVPASMLLTAFGPEKLRRMSADGELEAQLTGAFSARIPPSGWRGGEADLDLELHHAHATFGQMRLPIERGRARAKLAGKKLMWDTQLYGLGGEAGGAGMLGLDATGDLRFECQVNGLHLQRAYGAHPDGRGAKYRGQVRGNGTLTAQTARWPESLGGQGRIEVEHGELLRWPVLGELTRIVDHRVPFLKLPDQDRGHAEFELYPDHVAIRSFEVGCLLVAASGRGSISYDRRVNLWVNAAALPAVGAMLGPINELLGKVGNKLVSYRVEGTIDAPQFRVVSSGLTKAQ